MKREKREGRGGKGERKVGGERRGRGWTGRWRREGERGENEAGDETGEALGVGIAERQVVVVEQARE